MSDNAIAKNSIKQYLASPAIKNRVEELLKDRASQFVTSITSMVGADQKLAECEPSSLFMACLTAASLDLPINKNLAFAHIVPYKNNNANVTEAQFQLGWRGYVQLAQRSGQYKSIAAIPVYEGQLVKEDPLRGNEYDWDAQTSDTVIGYVAIFVLTAGFEKELYMSVDQIKKHADRYSKAYNHGKGFGPWKDNFDAMALKTVVKLLISKWGPMSVEMQKAVQVDQGVIKEDDSVSYIDGELTDVNADDDKKQAIIDANTPPPADVPDDGDTETSNAPAPETPKKPKESVAETAKRKYGPKQATLIDDAPKEKTDDNRTRNNPGR